MPAISDLVVRSGLDLVLVAGERGSGASIRWVHTSELPDPAPWLSGGELLLTTGMGLYGGPEVQGEYLRRLISARVAGLGFGLGFGFDTVPEALVAPANRCDFPIIGVPYKTPFIAISEWVSARLAEDSLEEAQATVSVHERLASLVAAGSGPADVLEEVAALTGGWAILFDLRGGVIARAQGPHTVVPDDRKAFATLPQALLEVQGPAASSELSPQGAQVGTAVMAGTRQEGVLVFGQNRRLGPQDRIVVRHATTVLGLLLSSRRAVIDAQRRVTGDIISEGFSGRLARGELERRLELVGFPPGAEVTALVLEPKDATGDDALDGYAAGVDDWLGSIAQGASELRFSASGSPPWCSTRLPKYLPKHSRLSSAPPGKARCESVSGRASHPVRCEGPTSARSLRSVRRPMSVWWRAPGTSAPTGFS